MKKEEFLTDAGSNWNNHRHLLWPALEATKHLKLPVIELGCGHGSTPFLIKYCEANGLEFKCFDSSQEWAGKFNAEYVPDWNVAEFYRKEYGLAFVDESPGENRKFSLKKLHHVKIVVAHDTEPAADHGYQMRAEIAKYKYRIDYKSDGAWASAMSNFIDVSKLLV